MLEVSRKINDKDSHLDMRLVETEGKGQGIALNGRMSHDFLANATASLLTACEESGVLQEAVQCYMIHTFIKYGRKGMEDHADIAVFTGSQIKSFTENAEEDNSKQMELERKISEYKTTIDNLTAAIQIMQGEGGK